LGKKLNNDANTTNETPRKFDDTSLAAQMSPRPPHFEMIASLRLSIAGRANDMPFMARLKIHMTPST